MKTIINQLPGRTRFRRGRGTLEIGYPWFTYGAIIACEQLVQPMQTVLELGSGGSTLFFSRRCLSVKSYESHAGWLEKVSASLPEKNNVSLFFGRPHALRKEIRRRELDNFYDWLIVDSGPSYRERSRNMLTALPKLKSGGYMVVDNYGNVRLHDIDLTDWKVYTFDDMWYSGKGTKICIKP